MIKILTTKQWRGLLSRIERIEKQDTIHAQRLTAIEKEHANLHARHISMERGLRKLQTQKSQNQPKR